MSESICRALASLVDTSGALTSMLITKEGTSLGEAGDIGYLNVTAMAALVAGMFTATREVARLVGEERFSILLQQGENRHIHIGLVTESTMLVLVFEDHQRIGRVRHEARKTVDRLLQEGLVAVRPTTAANEINSPEFKTVALDLIDRIFVLR